MNMEANKDYFKDKSILITGGAGSLGRELVIRMLQCDPEVIRILDHNENALFNLKNELIEHKNLRFLLGDVRDKSRLKRAMAHIDLVFHLAALKHVMLCEYDPLEGMKTNIEGMQNVIEAALENNVEKVVYTSSDKAANPNNTMGATKLLGERLMTSANWYRGYSRTLFFSVRFGNVLGTSGSVVLLWKHQIENNLPMTITDHEMTRFFMSKNSALDLILKCTEIMQGGEIFIAKMPVARIGDLAEVVKESYDKEIEEKIIGSKPGETYYEELMTESEAERALETDEMFIIPSHLIKTLLEGGDEMTFEYDYARPVSRKKYDSRDEKPLSKEEIRELLTKEGLI